MRGDKLILKIDGAVVAATNDVKVKWITKALESTSKDSGLFAEFEPGKVKALIRGGYLMAGSLLQFNSLYENLAERNELSITVYSNGNEIMNGFGVLGRLEHTGGNSDILVTGRYAIAYYPTTITSYKYIVTDTGKHLITDDGKRLITL